MNYNFISKMVLFNGIPEEDLPKLLECLGAVNKVFIKDEYIYRIGDFADALGMVIYGSVNIENTDAWGNKSILDHVEAGQVFAETYACLHDERLMVNVVASEKTEILFANLSHLINDSPNICSYHGKLINNLLLIFAQKNLNLSRRIFHTSSKSIRGRLTSYLSYQAVKNSSYQFTVPFNRQQLADYLGVDRSAMSNELSKMRKESLIDFEKNKFILNRKIYRKIDD